MSITFFYKYLGWALIAIAGASASCTGESSPSGDCTHDSVTDIKVDLASAVKIGDYIANVRGGSYDTSDDNQLIGEPKSAVVVGDTVYMADMFKKPGVYAYDFTGKPVFVFNSRGQGPGEFLGIASFQVHPTSVTVLDPMQVRMVSVDKDGHYLGSESTEPYHYPISFISDGKGGVWYDRGNNVTDNCSAELLYATPDSIIEVLAVPDNLNGFTFSASAPLYQVAGSGEVRYLPSFQPVIYKCSEGEASPLYRFDFGGKWPPADWLTEGEHPFAVYQRVVEKGYINALNAFEDESTLGLTFKEGKDNLYLLLYDKASGKQRLFDCTETLDMRPMAFHEGRLFVPFDEGFNFITLSD